MAEMARTIGLPVTGNADADKYFLAEELKHLIRRLKIKTLSEQGILRDDFEMLTEDVLREPVLGFNPRQNITKSDVITILEKAF